MGEVIFLYISSRTEHSEEDKQRDCVHYPTKDYQTYADCDQDYVRKTLPSDLVPFWNVDNISQASSNWESENEVVLQKARADSEILLFGQKLSHCKVQYFWALTGAQEMQPSFGDSLSRAHNLHLSS